jgi:ABC-type lipoprotein release transport system permease subunit
MGLFFRLAWRNLWRHRRRTMIVVIAIGFTMMLMLIYDGMMAGFNQAIYANAIKVMGGNIQAHAAGYRETEDENPLVPLADDTRIVEAALALPQVEAASRRIQTTGMATSPEGAFGVAIIGIEPEQEQKVNLLAQPENIVEGRFLTSADRDSAFVGRGLAVAMGVGEGDRITLVGRSATEQMRRRTLTVVGVYDLNMPDLEKQSIYLSLGEAQDLYELNGKTTEVVIMLKRLGQEPAVLRQLTPQFPASEIDSWKTNYPELQNMIATKSKAMDMFSLIMLAIAGIGILNLLLMAVFERTREIGVLGALGMKPRQITLLFLLEGAGMGLLGVGFGIALGLIANLALSRIGFDYSQFTSMSEYTALISGKLYTTLGTENLLFRSLTALVISIAAAIYPAREAARNEPAKALHFV